MYPCPSHGKGKIDASVWDITSKPTSLETLSISDSPRPPASTFSLPQGVLPGSVDVLTVIYVLSALHPIEWEQAIHNLYTVGFLSRSTCPIPYCAHSPNLPTPHSHTDFRPLNPAGSFFCAIMVEMIWPKYASRRTACSTRPYPTYTSEVTGREYTFSKKRRSRRCSRIVLERKRGTCLRSCNWARIGGW